MDSRIADTFTESHVKLTCDEQKAVKTTAFEQLNPPNPGMKFYRLNNVKDKNFWSVRVSADLRMIVHKTESSLLFCYGNESWPASERNHASVSCRCGDGL